MSAEPMMSADRGHAFSGGTLSEREVSRVADTGARPVVMPSLASRSESVSYRTRPCFGGVFGWAVLEFPAGVEISWQPTQEAAEAKALEFATWWDARPDPATVRPFFDTTVRVEPSFESLLAILERAERPERM